MKQNNLENNQIYLDELVKQKEEELKILQTKFNETIRRLELHQRDFEELKEKSVKSNFLIDHIVSSLTQSPYIIKEADRQWKRHKVYEPLLDFMNISIDGGEKFSMHYATPVSCNMSNDRKTVYMYFRVPTINPDLILIKPESFKLMMRKENETCALSLS